MERTASVLSYAYEGKFSFFLLCDINCAIYLIDLILINFLLVCENWPSSGISKPSRSITLSSQQLQQFLVTRSCLAKVSFDFFRRNFWPVELSMACCTLSVCTFKVFHAYSHRYLVLLPVARNLYAIKTLQTVFRSITGQLLGKMLLNGCTLLKKFPIT